MASLDKKILDASFGKGGVHCACCNSVHDKHSRKAARSARKRANKIAISEQTEDTE
jgi:hypothetical protein